ncbi:hypothetical protein [Paenibacillus sp. CF384]|uniref:hypothetical protein n=1 Tax=Paenibacillus sp. CF384 TaxID=1884382 RepID=UPI00089AB68E|nr:hypothetical protein [Paenibacillus sp. CF384]SDW79820.1 hypothetical protein SAMN05518855_1005150 [Paenibacillus sp. CF384]
MGGVQLATKEELEMIRDSCLLPMLLDVVEKQRKKMERTNQPLKALFLATNEHLLDLIHEDLVEIRRQLKHADIKVWALHEKTSEAAIWYRYKCRGYQNDFGIMHFVIKTDLQIKLGKYVARAEMGLSRVHSLK